MEQTPAFTFVDLFAGCGGLSLGLTKAGGRSLLAVEKSPMASETYYHNFIHELKDSSAWQEYLGKSIKEQANEGLLVGPVSELLSQEEIINNLASSQPVAIVGGPPCQGFSLAGRRNRDDQRNNLAWEFLDVVEKVSPKMVVIENVVGMNQKFKTDEKQSVFEQLKMALEETGFGYEVQAVEVNALHYGAPQHRPRLMLIGLRSDIAKMKKIAVSGEIWKSNFLDKINLPIPALAPVPTCESTTSLNVGIALADLNNPEMTNSYTKLMSSDWGLTKKSGQALLNHNKRSHQELSTLRFKVYQHLQSMKVDPRVLNQLTDDLNVNFGILDKAIPKLSFPATLPDGSIIASSRNELLEIMSSVRTKKHSQRVLPLGEPARTVVTIGDDYVHPIEPRTFTVRELARFQGFPNSFEFRSKETTGGTKRREEVPQYSQVGNAVSPHLALAVGNLIKVLAD